MIDATISYDQQLDVWYIQRGKHIEQIFPLTMEYIQALRDEYRQLMDDNRQIRDCLHAILDRGEAPERETSR